MSAMASVPGPRPGRELPEGAPDAPAAVSVVLSPQYSVVALLYQVAEGQSRGAPVSLLTAVRNALRPQARFAAQSLSRPDQILDACIPIPPLTEASVANHATRLRNLPAAALTSELLTPDTSRKLPPHWRGAADQPRRWLNSMADASLDTWAVAEPRWRAAGPLLDREIRRIGTAAVRGGMAALLNSLHPRISYHDGTFAFAFCRDDGIILCPVGRRRLMLVPMIAGQDALLINSGLPSVLCIGYPVGHPAPPAQTAAESALATILGPVRAAILAAVRQPQAVSELAAAVHCAPSTATYHLHQLTAAGLITRVKSGSSVRVSRTTRGDELVDLLSDRP